MPLNPDDLSAASSVGLTLEQAEALESYHSFDNFLKLHKPQFESMGLPPSLYRRVHEKIYNDQFDAPEYFDVHAIAEVEDEEDQAEEAPVHYELAVKQGIGTLKQGADVWLIDHCWSFNHSLGVKMLRENPDLVDRLWNIMEIERRIKEEQESDNENENDIEKQNGGDEKQCSDARLAPEESVSLVMQQAAVSRERAVRALKEQNGDLIEAINSLHPDDDTGSNQNPVQPQEKSHADVSRPSAAATAAALDESALSDSDRKAKLVWEALFKYQYAGLYYTMLPRAEGVRGPVRPEEVESVYYVNDEIGSAVRTAIVSNCMIAPFITVTLNGHAFSLLWLTKDVGEGQEVTKPVRPTVKMPAPFTL